MDFKLGLISPSQSIPLWASKMLEELVRRNLVSSIHIIHILYKDQSLNSQSGLFRLYKKLEDWKFKSHPDALSPVSIEVLQSNLETEVNSLTIDSLEDQPELKLSKAGINIFFNLCQSDVPQCFYDLAKYGFWNYIYQDKKRINQGPVAFWELFENHPTIVCSLKLSFSNPINKYTITESHSAIEPISVNRNANLIYWKCVPFFPREVDKMTQIGPEAYLRKIKSDKNSLNFYTSGSKSSPSNFEFLVLFLKRFWRYLKFKYNRVVNLDQWILMYHINDAPGKDLKSYKYIIPPKDRFWADPFIIYKDDKYYIFFEEALYSNPDHAYICYLTIDKTGEISNPEKVLHQKYHLSYPFVFKYNNAYWMIPESAENRTIEIYHCESFPEKWQLSHTLIGDIVAYDATLFEYNQKWWLFAGVVENKGASSWDELFLYYADSPLSREWVPHPKNPIVSDVHNARPAGKIFEYNDNLYRPSQNSSRHYGFGMKINMITKISEKDYEERTVDSLEPHFNSKIKALHTLNFENKITIIDAQRRRSRFF